MGVSIKVHLGGAYRKLDAKARIRGQYAMANQMLADMNQFVPKLSNTLRTTGRMSGNGDSLIWNTKYAKAQFYGKNGKAVFKNYSTPGTGKRWDLKAKGQCMDSWKRAYLRGMGI
ncbi:minor capsid protein [Faecalicatena contorta]|uniref:Minor capsid protein n=1 Tax=Faecalicatena contorta TaxID=39482 RepID=A0A315ZVX7_9FIRM|nr:minor capsid protein [Faecalicatena contorta]PWJ49352.1 minor capsid protein [Faecalicatena contorta]SUQ14596.1 Minor capsid protein [Faecalicatena contorta]